MAHTAGLWDCDGAHVFQCPIGDDDGIILATVSVSAAAGDARLMASAPTLLRCCEELLRMAMAANQFNGSNWAEYQRRAMQLVGIRGAIERASGNTLEIA